MLYDVDYIRNILNNTPDGFWTHFCTEYNQYFDFNCSHPRVWSKIENKWILWDGDYLDVYLLERDLLEQLYVMINMKLKGE